MFTSRKRLLVVVLALLGLVGLGYVAYSVNRQPAGGLAMPRGAAAPGKPGAGGPPGGFAVAVETARVAATDFIDEAGAVGTLKSNESVVLRPETPGRVAAIHFKDGTPVAKGSVLLALDSAVQDAELQQARANLALAETNYRRSQELLARKFISQQALDNVAATLKIQQAAVRLAEAKVGKMRIRAPFDGVVGLRNVSIGDYVKEGQDLINIEDVGTLKVDFRLPEAYLGRVDKGLPVAVNSDALPGQSFRAVLDAVDPLVDQNGRSISCRARLDNPEGSLSPGMFVRVRLIFGQRNNALMIPEQALVAGAAPTVFKVVDGKATAVKVRIGVRRTGQVEVVDGLAAGDLVVTAGQLKLREGAPVRAIGEGAPAARGAAAMQTAEAK
ncbi:MAG: efflux transporter periplasmic adaptor subunit [Rhodocyclaceae bacterium]|nr:efflux transporter periplasmic adaptor subunit [Rhodocyclaceae bacterium]